MAFQAIKADVEGDWGEWLNGESRHFAKRLSTQTAWHSFVPHELAGEDGVVQSVQTDGEAGAHFIHYQSRVEPLELDELRKIIDGAGRLAPWRLAFLAGKLFAQLKELHEAVFPQMLLHPGRIGRWDSRLVLLPTLAGVMPPLSHWAGGQAGCWLHTIAPEVLRTRATVRGLLFAGDVYSLGRTLWILCLPKWSPAQAADARTLMTQRIELPEQDALPPLPPAFDCVQDLMRRICARSPNLRPPLDSIIAQWQAIETALSPQAAFYRHLGEGQLPLAGAFLQEILSDQEKGFFPLERRDLLFMQADYALAQTPPDCQRAIELLQAAESRKKYEVDVQLRLGRAYARYGAHSQHDAFSNEAYLRAAGLSQWDGAIIEEWIRMLQTQNNPQGILAATESIPNLERSKNLIWLRTGCWMKVGNLAKAWEEICLCFPRFTFDQGLFDWARQIAYSLSPADLMPWLPLLRQHPGYAAALSIICEITGQPVEAARQKELAMKYTV